MKLIKCLFCGKPTTLHKINAQKKINNKIITIRNAPVYYCDKCDETFLSKEASEIFAYVRDRNLDAKAIMFEYEDMIKRLYK